MREKRPPQQRFTSSDTPPSHGASGLAAPISRRPTSSASLMDCSSRPPPTFSLLQELSPDVLHSIMCQLLATDLCALECCAKSFSSLPERAAESIVGELTHDSAFAYGWPVHASLPPPHGHPRATWKRRLAFVCAFIEGRRGCLGAGEAHLLLLSRRLRRLQPGGPVWPTARRACVAGEWSESSAGGAPPVPPAVPTRCADTPLMHP